MAGHSQFKNIMHRKGAQDAKRAKIFAKLAREITVAAKAGGADPEMNARLRLALQNARADNVPKDNIERAIKKASGGDADSYTEVRYEGYGPAGTALIIETLTDNRNRTTSNVRAAFTKYGGSLAETGAVAFKFERVGQIVYPITVASPDTMLEHAATAGADDCVSEGDYHIITCTFEDMSEVSRALEAIVGAASSVKGDWRPQMLVPITGDKAQSLEKLINILEDDDDVQNVFCDADFADAT
jgi:YebC/PmpR family DNA-binding regulatory protein